MPKAGFKSITISEHIHDKFQARYKKKKNNLSEQGITSFSGYLTFVLTKAFDMEDDSLG